jgi:hypothetical protein
MSVNPVLTLVPGFQPTPDDIQRELKMQDTLKRYHEARTPVMKRRYWGKYTSLHSQRGPDYVRYLELAKGLYRG